MHVDFTFLLVLGQIRFNFILAIKKLFDWLSIDFVDVVQAYLHSVEGLAGPKISGRIKFIESLRY